jgi:SpoVK/Ycf46/Vps4 family AAA+-type ATPase
VPAPKISLWSAILYGPPGTSKTTLAKAIAAELGWPLISLSPADFLARGDQGIEARSQEIFDVLTAGSRIVYFFDEIDELIRDRKDASAGGRSVFSFLTPSFLTKLQDFRDEAKKNEFIFIIGTNYFERIDSAAKRSGRIDDSFLVVYPDLPARAHLLLNHVLPPSHTDEIYEDLKRRLREWNATVRSGVQTHIPFLDMFAEFGGLLSYSSLRQLNERLGELVRSKNPDLSEMRNEMMRIRQRQHDRFRPEINLVDYAARGRDALTEAARIAGVIPRNPMPWLDAGDEPRLDMGFQWKEWRKNLKSEEVSQFETDLLKLVLDEVRNVL